LDVVVQAPETVRKVKPPVEGEQSERPPHNTPVETSLPKSARGRVAVAQPVDCVHVEDKQQKEPENEVRLTLPDETNQHEDVEDETGHLQQMPEEPAHLRLERPLVPVKQSSSGVADFHGWSPTENRSVVANIVAHNVSTKTHPPQKDQRVIPITVDMLRS
jgi:hypothetical protein